MFSIRIVYLDNEIKNINYLSRNDVIEFLLLFDSLIGDTIKELEINFRSI